MSQQPAVFRPVWFITQQGMFTILIVFLLVLAPTVAAPRVTKPYVFIVTTALALYCVYRCVATKLVILGDSLYFRDIWRARRIPWSRIQAFTVIETKPFPPVQIHPHTAVAVALDEGSVEVVHATSLLSRRNRDRLYAELRAIAQRQGIDLAFNREDLTSALEDPRRTRTTGRSDGP